MMRCGFSRRAAKGWTISGKGALGSASEASTNVTLKGDATVTAIFKEIEKYQIIVKCPAGATCTGDGKYKYDKVITITTDETYYYGLDAFIFSHWEANSGSYNFEKGSLSTHEFKVKLTDDVTFTAVYNFWDDAPWDQ